MGLGPVVPGSGPAPAIVQPGSPVRYLHGDLTSGDRKTRDEALCSVLCKVQLVADIKPAALASPAEQERVGK